MLKEIISYALNRVRYESNKYQHAVIEQKRHFEAAGHGRRSEKWYRRPGGPAADSNNGLRTLRGFSRDLVRNNSYAQRAVKVIATNTVGSGISPSFKGARSKFIKKAWTNFAGSTDCDFYKLMNFAGIQEQVMTAVAESGDALVVRRYNYNSPLGFDIQVLESDFLDETKNLRLDSGMIVQGVQFNSEGRRTGYWIFDEHPAEMMNMRPALSRFVPVSEVLHIFEVLRPGQVRGIPMGVSAFIRVKDFDEYQDAQLHQQKVAACFVAFVTSTSMGNDLKSTFNQSQGDEIPITDRLIPGVIEELPFGKDVKFAQPPTVSGSDAYSLTVLRAIAAGYNITYEALTNDYSNVNFSSGRMGWLEFARVVDSWQSKLMITQLCQGVYKWFEFGMLVMEGVRLNLDVTWTTPRREMIDPLKEGAAIIADIKAGILPRQEAIRQRGYDVEDVHAEIKEDMESENKLGAMFTTTVSKENLQAQKPGGATVKPQVTTLSKN